MDIAVHVQLLGKLDFQGISDTFWFEEVLDRAGYVWRLPWQIDRLLWSYIYVDSKRSTSKFYIMEDKRRQANFDEILDI